MRKNNLWNRIFHKKEVESTQALALEKAKLVANKNKFINELNKCATLIEVMNVHKGLWNFGFRNENVGPCSYSMFRTENISTMKPEEVYLGGVWGLSTQNIPFWEEHKDDEYGANGFGINPDTSLYKIILNQYKSHLSSNIKSIVEEAKKEITNYNINGYGTILS